MSLLDDDTWAEEWNRKLANGQNPSDDMPELPAHNLQRDDSWRREIELTWKTIDALHGPIADAMGKEPYQQTWLNVHRSYFIFLTRERERLLAGVLQGIDLGADGK